MLQIFTLISLLIFASSCSRSSSQTWEDVKTAGRYMQKGVDSILGKNYESRMLSSDEEFYGPFDEDFIPLRGSDLRSDTPIAQPKASPGQFGIPNLDTFYAPPDALRSLFSSIHFDTDQHAIRDRNEAAALIQLSRYLQQNPNLYLVIEGHCDERASASYNMALGMRRAHSVRSFLVKHGADLNRIYTISRGKEQPIAQGHTPEDWKMNRRSEFRIFQK